MLLGDADIDVLTAECGAVFGGEVDAADDARREIDKVWIPLRRFEDKVHGRDGVRVGCGLLFRDAAFDVKGRVAMPALGIVFGEGQSFALDGMDVDDDGAIRVLFLGEYADEFLRVVAVRDVAVAEPQRAEQVVLRRTVRLAQFFELAVHAAVVFGDGLVVVVEYDDEVRAHLADKVQPLKSLAARHRAVTDDDDDILCAAREVARLGKACSETDAR